MVTTLWALIQRSTVWRGLDFLKPTKWTSSLSLPSVAQIIPQKTAPAEKLLVADGVNVMLSLLLLPPTFKELRKANRRPCGCVLVKLDFLVEQIRQREKYTAR